MAGYLSVARFVGAKAVDFFRKHLENIWKTSIGPGLAKKIPLAILLIR
jgi:hypothetical protein